MPTIPLLATIVLASGTVIAADNTYATKPIGSTKAPYGFIEHLPDGAGKAGKKHPLVFFMHGHGELGDSDKDLPNLAKHGPFKLLVQKDPLAKVFADQSAILIAPQGLKADNWWKNEKLIGTFDYVLANYPVDPERIYVTGLSMGGGGTWTLATAQPDRIAAAAPVCGAGKPGDAAKLRGLPLWVFHAIDDPTVKFPETSQAWLDAILTDRGAKPAGGVMEGHEKNTQPMTGTLNGKTWSWKAGASPAGTLVSTTLNLTAYPNGGHDSWTRAYATPEFWTWLFAQKRASKR